VEKRFIKACRYGLETAKRNLITKDPSIIRSNTSEFAIEKACNNGHVDLMKYIFEMQQVNWKYMTCKKIHKIFNIKTTEYINVLEYLYELTGDDPENISYWTYYFNKSCRDGHEESVEWIKKKFADVDINIKASFLIEGGGCEARSPFTQACENGHIKIVQMLIKMGANIPDNINDTFKIVCEKGDIIMADFILDEMKCPSIDPYCVCYLHFEVFEYLCSRFPDVNHKHAAIQSLSKCPYDDHGMRFIRYIDDNEIFVSGSEHVKIFENICKIGHIEYMSCYWNEIMCKRHKLTDDGIVRSKIYETACINGEIDVVRWLDDNHLAGDYEPIDLLASVCENGHVSVAKWLIHKFKGHKLEIDERFVDACEDNNKPIIDLIMSIYPERYSIENVSIQYRYPGSAVDGMLSITYVKKPIISN
jgi:hypothetical protein